MYDVLEVNFDTRKVRLMAENATESNAEAVIGMAIARRGVEEAFFTTAPTGKFKEGDVYE